jgi:hypothetical protein
VDREADLEPDDSILRYNAIAMIGADRCCALHLRGEDGWGFPASQAQIEEIVFGGAGREPLLDLPAVGVVCTRLAPGRVRVLAARGQALVERREIGGAVEYRYVSALHGADPLRYAESPRLRAFVESGWHASRDWLTATVEERYPDFVPQIAELFESPRAGDLMLFADEDWTFRDNGHGGHGSALPRDARVSCYFAGDGLPRGGRVASARLVDMAPTILELLGESARLERIGPIDGVSLAPALRAAGARP